MDGVLGKGELGGVRAIVVDDETDVRDVIGEFLEMCGMDVRTACSGNEGFALFQEFRPSIVVSDVGMEDGSGLDLVRRIRALAPERGGLTPAIALTGASKLEECLEAGFHFHFTKPVDMLVLLDAIRDFVRSERAGRARWTVTIDDRNDVVIRFDGHVATACMRAAVSVLVDVLSSSKEKRRVIVDLTRLTGFDPAVGAAAQSVVWDSRGRIRDAVIVGGTWLSHVVARSICLMLGFACEVRDSPGVVA